jgi:FkbM family methyltransferase
MLDWLIESPYCRKIAVNLMNRFNLEIQVIPNEYLSNWVKKEKIATIIDIGAFNGIWMSKWRKIAPNATMYCFEPLSEFYNDLEKRARPFPNIKIFNFAIGDTNEFIEINHNKYGPSSSVLKMTNTHIMNYPFTSETKIEKVKIVLLDDALKNEVLPMNIMIKIDVQGYEDKVIKGGFNTFNKAKIIIIETSFVELYEGQPLFHDIYSEMERMGFTYAGSLGDYHGKIDGSVLQQDSVFIRQ